MKRILCLFLCLLLLLCGCGKAAPAENTRVFYYCRTDYAYGDIHSVIVPENREISPNASDLKSTLALYLVGPLDENLTSPFIGTRLVSVIEQDGHLLIELDDAEESMTDTTFAVASACMTMTCFALMDPGQVTITCGERKATMSPDNLLLYDNITSTEIALEDTE